MPKNISTPTPADLTPSLAPQEAVRRFLALTGDTETVSDTALAHFLETTGLNCKVSTPLFDVAFYLEQLPLRSGARENPVLHYFEHGIKDGLLPCLTFDPEHIEKQLRKAQIDTDEPALLAVLAQREAPFISPHPLFDPELYSAATSEPLEGRLPIEDFLSRQPYDMRVFSPYFDIAYYLHQAPHVKISQLNPLVHYLSQAAGQRSDPNPMFHAGFYRNTYDYNGPDALAHFVKVGTTLGRLPNPYAEQELGINGMTPDELTTYLSPLPTSETV